MALAGGALCAFSLPPWGWWPLAFLGILLIDRSIADAPAWSRFRRGWLAGIGLLAPSTVWMVAFTPPGYLVQVVVFGAILGCGVALCPPGRARWIALPAVWVLFEGIKGRWPFGGVPLSELAVGQVAGPLSNAAGVGGVLLLAMLTVAVGVSLSAAWERRTRAANIAIGAVAITMVIATFAPSGTPTGETISVALVQGGGEQGTSDDETDDREVFLTHLRASEDVPVGTDLTVWPENVVNVDKPIDEVREGRELADLARRKDTTLVVGVVESAGPKAFRNAVVVFDPEGEIIGRYEKVRRVPFGEFVPFRSTLVKVAGDALPSKDAIVGETTNTLDTPAARIGLLISWEVFFGDRGRDAVNGRGRPAEILLNPTNGSSYSGTIVQSQQIGASRLRAIETGRWEAQIAPTGFTAFVSPTGEVFDRTAVSEQKVITRDVELREGRTPYLVLGVWPTVSAAFALLALAWIVARREAGEAGEAESADAQDADAGPEDAEAQDADAGPEDADDAAESGPTDDPSRAAADADDGPGPG